MISIKPNSSKSNNKKARGNGSIYFVESRQRYVGQVTVEIYGKSTRKTFYGKTVSEVRHKIQELQYQVKAGLYVKNDNMTIKELAQKMIDEQLALNEIKQSSYDRKAESLKRLKPIYDIKIQDIDEDEIKIFLITQVSYSQSTINKVFQLLKAVMREAVRKKIITENPMEFIKKPKSNQEIVKVRALTLAEQTKLLNVLKTENVLYSEQMLLSMFTGMRMGEINALEVRDIDLKKGIITVRKTISRGNYGQTVINNRTKTQAGMRKLKINKDIVGFLKDCIGDKKSGLLFTRKGGLITTSQVNNEYSRVLKKFDIIDDSIEGKVDLHSLRHTYATRCIESGMPAKVLQHLLGHTDITVTMNTYCDAFDEFSEENLTIADCYLRNNNLQIA